MKKIVYLLTTVLLAACSAPKYTASFNSYDSPSGRLVQVAESPVTPVAPHELIASTSAASVEIQKVETPIVEVRKTNLQISKTERRALRTQLRSDIKTYLKAQKKNLAPNSTQSTNAMDNDLKLAAIFGAVGLVGLIIGTNVFFLIGGIALIIGVVFFVKWLIRQ